MVLDFFFVSFCSVRSMMSRGMESDPVCVTLSFRSVKLHLVSPVFVGLHLSHLVKKLNYNNSIVQKSTGPYTLIPPCLKANHSYSCPWIGCSRL